MIESENAVASTEAALNPIPSTSPKLSCVRATSVAKSGFVCAGFP